MPLEIGRKKSGPSPEWCARAIEATAAADTLLAASMDCQKRSDHRRVGLAREKPPHHGRAGTVKYEAVTMLVGTFRVASSPSKVTAAGRTDANSVSAAPALEARSTCSETGYVVQPARQDRDHSCRRVRSGSACRFTTASCDGGGNCQRELRMAKAKSSRWNCRMPLPRGAGFMAASTSERAADAVGKKCGTGDPA